MECLKETIRQKDALEKTVKSLKNEKTVSDAEVTKLKEDLSKYKTAFGRVSEIAADAKKAKADVQILSEQLKAKTTDFKKLQVTVNEQLTEDVEKNRKKVEELTEKLISTKTTFESTEQQLNEQISFYKKQASDRTDLAKKYKARYTEVLNRYILSKANMLGVRDTEIISRLDEQYTLDDIDKVYEQLLTEGTTVSRLPNIGTVGHVRINEAKQTKPEYNSYENGYAVDNSLLELAGLI